MGILYFLKNFFRPKPHHLQRGWLPVVSLLQTLCLMKSCHVSRMVLSNILLAIN